MAKQPSLEEVQNIDLDRKRPDTLRSLIRRYYKQAGDRRNIRKSQNWFWEKAVKLGRIRNSKIFAGGYPLRSSPRIGRLYYFEYDAKWKDTLPYWDRFPLVFPFNIYKKDGTKYMTGINLHYLPPKLRAVLFANLMTIRNEKRYRDNTKLKISWAILKNLSQHRLVQPCVKSYIIGGNQNHVRSRWVEIPATDWEIVVPLNIARFQKASQQKVWSEAGR